MIRITSIEPIPVSIPYTHAGPPTGFGGSTWSTLTYLLVRVQTEDGLVGWGEAFGYTAIPATMAALNALVVPLAVGRDATSVVPLMQELQRTLHIFGRGGPTQFALSGLEIALWDLAGKRLQCSVSQLLGGRYRDEIAAYTSLLRIGDPATIEKACERAIATGFKALKLHEITEEAVAAARQALGPEVELMLDVNCAWDLAQALDMAHRLAPYRLKWLEEPVWPPEDVSSLARLRASSPVPLAAGENLPNAWSFGPLVNAEAVDFVQPSVTKVGGISACMQIADMARFHGLRLAPHSPYFGPGLLATLQVAAVIASVSHIECFGVELETPLFGSIGLPGPDGQIAIPDGPGLGADPEPDVLERLRTDRN